MDAGDVVTTPAPIDMTSGIDIATVAGNGSVPAVSVGSTPTNIGIVPTIDKVVIPGTALLEANMETVDNTFNPFIDETAIQQTTIPSTPNNTGVQPKSGGKVVK